jgi:MFS family permease
LFGVVPVIATRDRVADAYGILVSTEQMLRVATTAVAGVLVTATGAENALWIDAAGYVISAGLIAFVPRSLRAAVPEDRRQARITDDIVEGLKYVRRHPVIWPLTVTGLGVGLVSGAVNGLIVVYGVRQLGLTSNDARLAWLFTALAVGGLLAGLALPVLSWRFNPVLITLMGLVAATALLIGLALQAGFIPAMFLLTGWGGVSTLIVYNGIRLRQQLSPDRLQGRVNLTARMITIGAIPLGAIVAGTLADQLGVAKALLIMTVLLVGTAGYAWTSPLSRVHRDYLTRLQADAELD